MDNVIMCFPGQGSQKPNMAIDLYNYSPKVRDLFEMASDISHLDLHNILTEGNLEILKQTQVAQNAIVLASLSAFVLLKEKGITPFVTAGFSLGELMALRASEVIDSKTLFKLIHKRSSLMAHFSEQATKECGEMAMAAVIGLNSKQVETTIEKSKLSKVFVANDNSEKQVVISGVKKEIDIITPLLKEKGARAVIFLKVSGPFHTPLLQSAEVEFKKYLDKVDFKKPINSFYSNVTGKREEDLKELVAKQITNKVQWLSIMKDIKSNFNNYKIYEVGVSKTLTAFFKSEDMVCTPCGTIDQIKGL